MTYVLLFAPPANLKGSADIAGKTLAVSRISLDNRVANAQLASAKLISKATTADVVAAVCSGDVQAGLLAQSSILGTRLPDCPERELDAIPVDGGTFWFGIGANRNLPYARAAADSLRWWPRWDRLSLAY